ncbi:hypothetical protein Lser_V15G36721 [Lactuca serriola]
MLWLSWETTEDVLREHFEKYGKVMDVVIAKDRITGTSRGFVFVSFSEASTLNEVLLNTHTILGRLVEVKKAIPRHEYNQNILHKKFKTNDVVISNNNIKIKKIFVGGFPTNITKEEFKVYFEQFGRITDVIVMHDNITHRPRGFGFITFDSEDFVEQVMQKSFHELCGKLVEVKRVVPKEDNGGGNGINNYLSGGNGIGNYFVPVYGGYPFGYYGGFNYGLGPWGYPYHMSVYPSYMNNGYELTGMGGIMGSVASGKSSQLSDQHGASFETCI